MKKFALYENSDKPDAVKFAESTARKLISFGAECCAKPELVEKLSSDISSKVIPLPAESFEKFADIVISFGGDGTMLSIAHILIKSDIPIIGINVGKLGFLAEYSIDQLDQSLDNLLEGNYRVVDRAVIESELDGEIIYALNDFVVEKKSSSRMLTIVAYANDHHIGDYRADGLILTSPTGSTAYSLSCGGPVIAPSTKVFCITPISPHSMNLRPLVIPDSNEVVFEVYSPTGEASLVSDGQIARTIKNGQAVSFHKSEAIVKLVKPLNSSYFDLLRNKLLWAANPVDNKYK